MRSKKKGSKETVSEAVETENVDSKKKKKTKKEKTKKEKQPMDIDSKKTLLKSITAIACVIAICITAVVNTGKLCNAAKEAAQQTGSASTDTSSDGDATEAGETASDEVIDGDVATDEQGEAVIDEGTEAEASGDDSSSASQSEASAASSTGTAASSSSSTASTTAASSSSSIPTGVSQIVTYYNTATAKVASKKAPFTKTRTTTEKSYDAGASLKASKSIVYGFMGVGDSNKFTKSVTSEDADSYQKYFKASKLTTSDVTSATCNKSGNNYTITLKIKDGSSSVKSGKVVSSNNAPLDRSGLACGDNDKNYWDHKTAENVMSAISQVPLCGSANIDESYSNAVITAVVNASTGNLVSLNAKFDFKFELSSVMGSSGTATASTVVNMTDFKM